MATKPAKKTAAKTAAAKKTVAAAPAVKKTAAKKAAPAVKKAPVKKTAASSAAETAAKRAENIARKSLRKPATPGVEELKFGIESAFERRATLTLHEIEGSTKPLVGRVIDGLETGEFRVAEPDGHGG